MITANLWSTDKCKDLTASSEEENPIHNKNQADEDRAGF